jgi:hypothetical protein
MCAVPILPAFLLWFIFDVTPKHFAHVLPLAAGITPGDLFSSTAQLSLLGLHSPFGTDQQLYVRNGRPLSLILGPLPKEEGDEGGEDEDEDYIPIKDPSLKGGFRHSCTEV